MPMKNYRVSDFDQKPSRDIRKSLFDLGHQVKTQMCMGRYYPIHWEEVYPGDELFLDTEMKFEFPSTYLPLQQIGTVRGDWWYCPYNVLFRGDYTDNYNKTGWKGFIMGEDVVLPRTELNINGDPGDGVSNLYPGCSYPIENYMGFPYDTTDRIDSSKQWGLSGNAFPLAMYLICYDEGYRNPLWEEPQFFNLSENPSTNATRFNAVRQTVDGIQYVSWDKSGSTSKIINHPAFFAHYPKDYFTASRPSPQDGDPVQIPMMSDLLPLNTDTLVDASDGTPVAVNDYIKTAGGDGEIVLDNFVGPVAIQLNNGPTVEQIRLAQIMQQFKELVARFGKRYPDWIAGTHDVHPEPGIMDIPQLIGSVFGRIIISNTMTTADTSESFTGNYRGNMNFYDNGSLHNYFVQDYGLIMFIVNIMPDTGYGQGMHPKWTREVAQDYPLDIFSGIGDQEIKRKELLAVNIKAIWDDPDKPYDAVIGYNDRFADSKTAVNRMFTTKEMYDSWYMGQKLTTVEADYDEITAGRVIVGASYSTSNGIREADVFNVLPIKSGNSTYTDATVFAHFVFTIKVKRCLPFFSIPGKMIF